MVNTITKNVQLLDVKGFNEILKSLQLASDATAQKLVQFNINHPQEALNAFQQIANITVATKTLPKAFNTLKYTFLFTGLMVVLATWIIVRIVRNLEKHTDKISANVQALSTEIASQGNLSHRTQFASAVHNFIQLKRAEQFMYPENYPVKNEPSVARYIVFHPASDWHADFFALDSGGWRDSFYSSWTDKEEINSASLFNNPERYTAYLREHFQPEGLEGNENPLSVTHILLPSTYTYTLPFTLRVPEHLHPVRVAGQTDRYRKPYCRACIIGADPSHVVDVDLLAEHEAPDYALHRSAPDCAMRRSAPDKRLYPILWLVVAALWLQYMLGAVVESVGDVAWNAWNAYLGLREFLSFGV